MDLINLCKQIEDPRLEARSEYSLEEIVYISLAAVICGAETWNEIEYFGNMKFDFFKSRLPNLRRIPSHDTLNRFFTLLSPDYFELVFRNWVLDICGKYEGVVAIDGKTIRGASKCSKSHPTGKSGFKLHMVSAWAVSNGISLGQVKVNDKSNEITAIPSLVKSLDLTDCIVTIDAMGCQKEIAKTIVDRKADYVLALKGNQKKTYAQVCRWFESYDREKNSVLLDGNSYAEFLTQEISHGRIEKREYLVFHTGFIMEDMLHNEFKGVKSVVRVKSERTVVSTQESSTEFRYYITTLGLEPERIAHAVRSHWSVENCLHWQLDVSFSEDAARRTGNGAQNYSLMNKMALQIIKNNGDKASIKSKRKKAGWKDEYLADLMQGVVKIIG